MLTLQILATISDYVHEFSKSGFNSGCMLKPTSNEENNEMKKATPRKTERTQPYPLCEVYYKNVSRVNEHVC